MIHQMGWLPDYPDIHDYTSGHKLVKPLLAKVKDNIPPDAIDLREWCSLIEDQKNLGSCTAQAGMGLWEYYQKRAFGDYINGSRLFLYKTTRNLMHLIGDTGAYCRTTMGALVLFGVPPEEYWPYTDRKPDFDREPPAFCYSFARNYQTIKYFRIDVPSATTIDHLKQVKMFLANGFPQMFGFTVYSSIWDVGQDGKIPYPYNERAIGGHAVCLSGETIIPLLENKEIKMKTLVEEYSDKSFWIYSCDKKGNIVPGLAHSPRRTGIKKSILKITIDNGKEIKCTEDHLILMRNGSCELAKNIKKGDSLMPFHRKIEIKNKDLIGYEKFLNPSDNEWYYTHRSVNKYINGFYDGVVHHKDFNKRNNSPENLKVMSWKEHSRLHQDNMILLTRYIKSKEGRQQSRELMLNLWSDPAWRAKSIERNRENGRKVGKKLASERRLGFMAWDRKELRMMNRENAIKGDYYKRLNSEEANKKSRETLLRKFKEDEKFRERMKIIAIKNLQEYRCKYSAELIGLTDKQIEARRNNMKKLNQNKELRRKRQIKTTYTRFYKNKYPIFEDYLESKNINLEKVSVNHKVISVEFCGCEDVYDITVEKHHNFAIGAGIFVHNCAVGYDDSIEIKNPHGGKTAIGALLIRNSWGKRWGDNGYGWLPYKYVLSSLARDFWTIVKNEWVETKNFTI